MAARQRGVPSTTSYQRVERPASGKVKNEPLLKERGTGTKIGTTRNTRIKTQQVQRAPTRIRSAAVGYGDNSMALQPILKRSRPRKRVIVT